MIQDVVQNLSDLKGLEAVIPFIVVFVLVYSTLNKINIFKNKKVDITLGIVLGILTILPHFTGIGPNLVPTINIMLPSFSLLLVMLLSFILITGFLGLEMDRQTFANLLYVLIIIELILPDTLIIALILNNLGVDVPPWLEFFTTDEFLIFAILSTVTVGAIYFITKDNSKTSK